MHPHATLHVGYKERHDALLFLRIEVGIPAQDSSGACRGCWMSRAGPAGTWMSHLDAIGRFRSAKLEAAFNNYLFAIWLPRFRMITSVGVLIELWALIDSLLCGCGVGVGVYTGGTLIYSYVFPSSICWLSS